MAANERHLSAGTRGARAQPCGDAWTRAATGTASPGHMLSTNDAFSSGFTNNDDIIDGLGSYAL